MRIGLEWIISSKQPVEGSPAHMTKKDKKKDSGKVALHPKREWQKRRVASPHSADPEDEGELKKHCGSEEVFWKRRGGHRTGGSASPTNRQTAEAGCRPVQITRGKENWRLLDEWV